MTLTEINLALAIIGLSIVVALFVVVRREMPPHGRTPRGTVHARVGSTVLLLFAMLGVATAVGAWIPGQQDYLAIFAVALRVGFDIILFGWIAWEVESKVRGRSERFDGAVDCILTLGHHDTHGHQH